MESRSVPSAELHAQFGEIDIYLFDQLLRGRFDARRRVLDAGCGAGRNLPYFLARGFEIYAIDEDPGAVAAARKLAAAAGAEAAARTTSARARSTRCPGPTAGWTPWSAAPSCTSRATAPTSSG